MADLGGSLGAALQTCVPTMQSFALSVGAATAHTRTTREEDGIVMLVLITVSHTEVTGNSSDFPLRGKGLILEQGGVGWVDEATLAAGLRRCMASGDFLRTLWATPAFRVAGNQPGDIGTVSILTLVTLAPTQVPPSSSFPIIPVAIGAGGGLLVILGIVYSCRRSGKHAAAATSTSADKEARDLGLDPSFSMMNPSSMRQPAARPIPHAQEGHNHHPRGAG